MMEKFGRIYDMRISTPNGDNIAISLPWSLDVDITRSSTPTANVGQFKLYNLPEHIRNKIRFDISSISERQEVALKAGYKSIHKNLNDLPLIFRGSIKYAFSERQGVDWITTIECYDGGFAIANSKINASFIAGEKFTSNVEKVLATFGSVKIGHISKKLIPPDKKIMRGHPVDAKTFDYLNENFSNNWFIDNGIVNILGDEEAFVGIYKKINVDTGLLSTPIREETNISFNMIFEPRLLIGQAIDLESVTDPAFNGTYKLITIKHRGTISPVVSGELVTSCRVFKGTGKLEVVA